MSKEDQAVYRAIRAALEAGRPCVLATVVATRGSTPRKTGAKMVVDPETGLVGTIGGGCGEAEVIVAAREVLEEGRPRMVRVSLTDDPLSWSASVCGGVLDVFVEPVLPTCPLVRIHYLRPPGRLEVFTQHLVLDTPEVKVTFSRSVPFDPPIRIGEQVALEAGSDVVWFTFPGAWHDIGRFHRADGTLTGIYANILTPAVFREDGVWETTDLFLDLWVDLEGKLTVLDGEEWEEALREGWIDAETAQRARGEAERLVAAHREGSWPPPIVGEWTRERAIRALGEQG